MIGCYYSGNCAGCVFDGRCLIQIELIEQERRLKEMVGLMIAVPIGCKVMDELSRSRCEKPRGVGRAEGSVDEENTKLRRTVLLAEDDSPPTSPTPVSQSLACNPMQLLFGRRRE